MDGQEHELGRRYIMLLYDGYDVRGVMGTFVFIWFIWCKVVPRCFLSAGSLEEEKTEEGGVQLD